jgi:phosphatidylethanolamine/phosphatidyl-N-methylethanolamine N-methyltransferase
LLPPDSIFLQTYEIALLKKKQNVMSKIWRANARRRCMSFACKPNIWPPHAIPASSGHLSYTHGYRYPDVFRRPRGNPAPKEPLEMKSDPSYDDYMERWTRAYATANYDQGLAARLLTMSHVWCERAFGPDQHFSRVLEVGAGTGIHLSTVRHTFDEYVMTDLNPPMLDQVQLDDGKSRGRVLAQQEDATRLSFADASFDRLIATHVLEHLPRPHEVLREWQRVLKPGGTMSIVLPCDPGLAWRLGRHLGPRRKFQALGIDYDYWMARDHINAITNLVAFIRYYYPESQEKWYPLRIPSSDLNLFYVAHIRA